MAITLSSAAHSNSPITHSVIRLHLFSAQFTCRLPNWQMVFARRTALRLWATTLNQLFCSSACQPIWALRLQPHGKKVSLKFHAEKLSSRVPSYVEPMAYGLVEAFPSWCSPSDRSPCSEELLLGSVEAVFRRRLLWESNPAMWKAALMQIANGLSVGFMAAPRGSPGAAYQAALQRAHRKGLCA